MVTWTVRRMPGFRLTHPFIAVDPECPPKPHPTRWCRCRVHRTEADATAYAAAQAEVDGLAADLDVLVRGDLP